MQLTALVQELGLDVRCCPDRLGRTVTGGYVGDLLSDVMAHSSPGMLWITRQVHQNIIAVAALKEHAGIIIVQGARPDDETLVRAAAENLPLMVTSRPAFEIAGAVYRLLQQA